MQKSVQPNELHAFAYSVLCVYLSALLHPPQNHHQLTINVLAPDVAYMSQKRK